MKSDGTVVAAGNNFSGQCNVESWKDIIAIDCSLSFVCGLKSDGTVVAAGNNDEGACNVGDWRDIIVIFAGDIEAQPVVNGIKTDGTVVFAGYAPYNQYNNVQDWKLFNSIDTLEQEIEENKTIMLKRIEKEKEIACQKAIEKEKKRREQKIQELNRNLESHRRTQAECERNLTSYKSELANLRGLFTGKKRKELGEQIAENEHKISALRAEISSFEKELQELQK